jgi:hypothetical protein
VKSPMCHCHQAAMRLCSKGLTDYCRSGHRPTAMSGAAGGEQRPILFRVPQLVAGRRQDASTSNRDRTARTIAASLRCYRRKLSFAKSPVAIGSAPSMLASRPSAI